jgi:hypothetical protein
MAKLLCAAFVFLVILTPYPEQETMTKYKAVEAIAGYAQTRESIDVRLAEPLQWSSSCEYVSGNLLQAQPDDVNKSAVLKVSLDRLNNSTEIVYLPSEDVDIELAVVQVQSTSAKKGDEVWLPIYGPLGDMKSDWKEAKPFPVGQKIHNDICFYNTAPIADFKEHEGRNIPIRGKLRIRASYFQTERDWQDSINTNNPKEAYHPRVVTIEREIPCFGTRCSPGCNLPPHVLHGETTTYIDISRSNIRGAAISQEFARLSPECGQIR